VIFKNNDIGVFASFFPQPTPQIRNWKDNPLSEYGSVWEVFSGEDVPKIMAQFDSFPGFHILKDDQTYYITAFCAEYPFP
jgi:hypothetical protein